MKDRPRFYSKVPWPVEKLHDKSGELTYRSGDIDITAKGTFMVAGPNARGLCEVMFQHLDLAGGKWVRLYLGQKHVDKLVFPAKDGDPITCEDILEHGCDLTNWRENES